jgi:hypothetical protein
MSIEAMKQALEALEESVFPKQSVKHYKKYDDAVNALTEAIEQAEKWEPVAWVYLDKWKSGEVWPDDCFTEDNASPEMTPLYTAPPKRQWVGLTDDEICEVAEIDGADAWLFEVARSIEAKLKEKNT